MKDMKIKSQSLKIKVLWTWNLDIIDNKKDNNMKPVTRVISSNFLTYAKLSAASFICDFVDFFNNVKIL